MTEYELKVMFWLDQCLCGLVWDKRDYCQCGIWDARFKEIVEDSRKY